MASRQRPSGRRAPRGASAERRRSVRDLARRDPDELKNMLRAMMLIRVFEDRVAEQYTRARIGGYCHLNIGEEASVVGMIFALQPRDYIITAYREHGYALARGISARATMAELFGRQDGTSKGRGGSMHLFDAERNFLGGYGIVAGQMPLAVGTALASDYRGTDEVTLCQFGEGSTNIGYFHESLNLAKVWRLPVVFACTNNKYGMGTDLKRVSAVDEVWRRAAGYDMPGNRVDGMDVLACLDATRAALERARRERLPSLLEFVTYRFRGHSMADPGRYRQDQEIQTWRERDPAATFPALLIEAGILSADEHHQLEEEVRAEVEDAVQFAEESPEPPVEELYAFTYAPEGV